MGLIVLLVVSNLCWATAVIWLVVTHGRKEELWDELMEDAANEHQRLRQELERAATHDVLGYPKR